MGTYVIACTRYNNKTWDEYQNWKSTNAVRYEEIFKKPLKCIYGSPRENDPRKIEPNKKMIIIEMQNDINKIMGIVIIENRTASEVYRIPRNPKYSRNDVPDLPQQQQQQQQQQRIKFKIFEDNNYNRYIYTGNEFYISREELEREPEMQSIVELEALLFKGSRHSKRGSGLSKIPKWIIEEGHTTRIEKYIEEKYRNQ